eukprot:gnl/TRDRNA2_/TRDRNA2_88036_c0_seq1.p1 gnl/TRDRNA2_/TRDRNA2_88036_c0~~gnl/TRDRNA2_/TRDRNA2_88036_c0_seq1.p1  ORF type:complete len:317 (-),score=46.18 gnl/TRDRNA2_/TRDRNA2_88036_c0_seq1:42-992(-)
MTCQNPDCEFDAWPDPEVSWAGYCCEKCQARSNGEEWAQNLKQMHMKMCTSKVNSAFILGQKCANPECPFAVSSDPWQSKEFCCVKCDSSTTATYIVQNKHCNECERIIPAKCAHPECNFYVNQDPGISEAYCCQQCEGLDQGEDWAQESKKRHFKNCQGIEFGKILDLRAYSWKKEKERTDTNEGVDTSYADQSGFFNPASYGLPKCAHPECQFAITPEVSDTYCCWQCQGLHQNEEWAANSKKRHYKNCGQIPWDGVSGKGKGKGGKGSWKGSWGAPNPYDMYGPYGAMEMSWGMKGGKGGKGGKMGHMWGKPY